MTMNPTRMILRSLAALVLAVAVTLQSGCLVAAAGAAGAGTVAYLRGQLASSLDQSYDTVVRASNRAVEQLEFARISETKDALTAIIIARTAEDKKIEIKVIKVSESLSKVEIRVGIFGDEAISMTILDRIKANL